MPGEPTYQELLEKVANLESAAQKNEAFLRRVIDLIPNVIVIKDRNGKIILANKAAATLYGSKAKDMTGRYEREYAGRHPSNADEIDKFLAIDREVIDSGRPRRIPDETFTLANGDVHTFDVSKIPMKAFGCEDCVLVVAADVTEHRRAKAALERTRQELRDILDACPALIWQKDGEGKFLLANRKFCETIGSAPEEVIGKTDYDLFPEEIANGYAADDQEVMTAGISRHGILERHVKPSGEVGWSLTDKIVWRDKDGRISGTIGFALDITARKQAEEALRRKSDERRILLDTIDTQIWYLSDIDTYGAVNRAHADFLGYHPREIAYKRLDEFLPEDVAGVCRISNIAVFETRQPVQTEEWAPNGRGEQRLIQITKTPKLDENRNVEFVVCVGMDITEKRELEKKLREAAKMQAIATLSGGIAHEFNNMLGIVIGNIELAAEDIPEWSPAGECLREIRSASLRARDVVRKLLSVARTSPAAKKPVRIDTLFTESLDLLRQIIPPAIDLRVRVSCGAETISANPAEIHQVLTDLCTNAVHAMSEAPGALEIALDTIGPDQRVPAWARDLRPGAYARITVKDTGNGIDPAVMDRIFDPYFTTKDVGKGIGMGLALVHGIVKAHDGEIHVESEPGNGTTVAVLFPLAGREPAPAGSERILFVDDEAPLVKMVTQVLQRSGYDVVGKTASREALAAFKSDPGRFDMVITDMVMPDLSGDGLAREILRIKPDIPIILFTGNCDRIDIDSALELGIKAVALKPLMKADLIETVRKILDEAKGMRRHRSTG